MSSKSGESGHTGSKPSCKLEGDVRDFKGIKERHEQQARIDSGRTFSERDRCYLDAVEDRAELIEAVARWGQHEPDCIIYCHTGPPKPCTCGLDEFLSLTQGQPIKQDTGGLKCDD